MANEVRSHAVRNVILPLHCPNCDNGHRTWEAMQACAERWRRWHAQAWRPALICPRCRRAIKGTVGGLCPSCEYDFINRNLVP
jgi:hypothetical protein